MIRSRLAALALALAIWAGCTADAAAAARDLRVISFNIKFVGNSPQKRNEDLADMLAPYDLVFVQELVAPPFAGTFPDGDAFVPDAEAAAFFEAMKARRFDFVLSEEDTGTGDEIHRNDSRTEWFVAFYKPSRVTPAASLPHGFLAGDRSNNPDFERVPYAFAFKAGNTDLVFISVHLKPDPGPANRARRAHELSSIFSWIASRPGREKDYVVLGDMNLQNCAELTAVLPADRASLNGACQATTTNPNSPHPYDQVFYSPADSPEINARRGLTVIDLVGEMRLRWPAGSGAFAGNPFNRTRFESLYSDHHPVLFAIKTGGRDDD